MSTFVLVPGAWLGGWVWSRVSPMLEERGCKVYAVTLTGMGERAHLASKDLGIETAIQDVLNVIRYNDLIDVVLVGHSFASKVSAAVADRASDRVRVFINLDGYIPEKVRTPQGSFPDEFPVEGTTMPFPESFLKAVGKDVQSANRDWLLSKASPLPARYYRDSITLSEKYDYVRRSYIFCTGGDTLTWLISQSTEGDVDKVLKAKLDGPYRLIDSGHWPMITKPKELVEDMLILSSSVPV
jgi:pimeloyl-ACP methyl ester carboxylesterase